MRESTPAAAGSFAEVQVEQLIAGTRGGSRDGEKCAPRIHCGGELTGFPNGTAVG